MTSEEWAIFVGIVLFICAILYARANKKQKTKRLRERVADQVYRTAVEVQKNAIVGVNQNVLKGAGVNTRTTPMDLQDPSRLYVRSALTQRDYLMENEYLTIDEPTVTY